MSTFPLGAWRAHASRCAFLAVTVAGLLAPRRAAGQTDESAALPLSLEVVGSEGCPAARFADALEARVRRRLVPSAEARTSLRVTLRAGLVDPVEGVAVFEGSSGRAERVVRGSCEDVSAALALVAATWLEAEPRPASAPPAPVSLASPAPAPAPVVAAPASAAGHVFVGAHAIATFGLVRASAFGAGIAVDYETRRVELRGAVRGALAAESLTVSRSHYAWLGVALDGCVHALEGAALRVAGCARLESGYFRVSFGGQDHALPWVAAGLGPRVGAMLGPARLEVEALGLLPVTGYRVDASDVTLVPLRSLALAAAIGIMTPIP